MILRCNLDFGVADHTLPRGHPLGRARVFALRAVCQVVLIAESVCYRAGHCWQPRLGETWLEKWERPVALQVATLAKVERAARRLEGAGPQSGGDEA